MAAEQNDVLRLIADCLQGKRAAQKKLYQQYYSYGLSICLHYAADIEEAKEIFNDGFLKVFAHLERYDAAYPFKTWLRRILINCAIDYYRRQEKFRHTASIIPLHEPQDTNAGLEQLSIDDVLRMVQQLPPAYRLVFNLHVVEGYNHREIGEQLGISEGTSKSNLAKARQKLQKMMQHFYPDLAKTSDHE